MSYYILKNISRVPIQVLGCTLASEFSSIKGVAGTIIIGEGDLSDYNVSTYLKRGSASIEKVIKELPEVIEEPPQQSDPLPASSNEDVPVEIEEVVEEEIVEEDDVSEPQPQVYSEEDLKELSSSELKAILTSLGGSTNSRKKQTIIKKILEAQNG